MCYRINQFVFHLRSVQFPVSNFLFSILLFQVTIDIPYASPPQGIKYFTIIGPHIDCMDEQYLVSFFIRL